MNGRGYCRMPYGFNLLAAGVSVKTSVTLEGVFMKKTMGNKIEIIKENPVAKVLMGPRYRMKVKVSKKVYRRTEQKRRMRVMLKNENGPMRSLIVFSGLMGSFSAGRRANIAGALGRDCKFTFAPLTGSGNWLAVDGFR